MSMNNQKVTLGEQVIIGSHCTIINATIGQHTRIGHKVFIGKNVRIGDNVIIEDACTIADNCTIDNNATVPFASQLNPGTHFKA